MKTTTQRIKESRDKLNQDIVYDNGLRMAMLLERAEDFVKDCKHNGENSNAAEWLADFERFQNPEQK